MRICPYGKQHLEKLVADCLRDVLWMAVLAVIVVFVWNSVFGLSSLLYFLESAVLAVWLVGIEVPNARILKKETVLYQNLITYFSKVKHRYIAWHHMANAILDAADGMNYEIQCLANTMYWVLMESNRKETVREYILHHPMNEYVKLFLIQSYEASEKGDLFFCENIEQLRLELMEELYRRRRRAYEFSGYVFVSVTPFFLMPVLRNWGMEFAPELEFFYAGTGVLLESIAFCVTFFVYSLLARAKETVLLEETEEKIVNTERIYEIPFVTWVVSILEQASGKGKEWIRKLLLLSGERTSYGRVCFQMWSVAAFTLMSALLCGAVIHGKERQQVLEHVESIDIIAPVAGEEKKAILTGHILAVTAECKNQENVTTEEIREHLRSRIRLGNENMEQAVVQEIENKIIRYKAARWSISELILCLLGSVCAGAIPVVKLEFQAHMVRSRAVYEVRQFQSIILMERRLPGMTVIGLLEDMEMFSKYFRSTLKKCINSYGGGADRALLRLKEEGKLLHEGFEPLADAFLSVDEVGIELAFAEVENNRRLMEKMTQLENEINLEKKRESTDLIAKLPMVLAVGAYFIIPFFMHSLQGVYEMFEILEDMQK